MENRKGMVTSLLRSWLRLRLGLMRRKGLGKWALWPQRPGFVAMLNTLPFSYCIPSNSLKGEWWWERHVHDHG